MTFAPLKLFHPHPNPRFQADWNWVQVALLAMPASPLTGGVILMLLTILMWGRQFRRFLQLPITWGFLSLTALMIGAASQAVDVGVAFIGLYNFVPLFMVWVVLSFLIQTPQQLRQLAWLLVLTSLPVVLIGMGQQFWGWAGHPRVLWILLDLLIDQGGNPPGRMASIFAYANVLASYLVIVWILTLALWIERFELWQARTPQPRPFWWQWGLLTVALLGMAIAILYTSSRNAWGVAIFAGLAFLLYKGWRWLVLGCVGFMTSIGLSAFGPSPIKDGLRQIIPALIWARLSDEMYPNRPMAELRRVQWQFAWSLAEQRPWTGWGLRSFSQLYEAQMNFWVGHPHNLLLMLAAETGWPVTLLLVSLVGWIVIQGAQCCYHWPTHSRRLAQDRFILFSYLIAFAGCTLLSTLDVTLFDLRVNVLGWVTLAGIYGLTCRSIPQAG